MTHVLLPLLLSACLGDPPEIQLSISPDPAYTDDPLFAEVQATSDTELVYRWFLEGVERTDITGPEVSYAETTKFQKWTLIVLPTRGSVEGAPAWDSRIISNSLPIASVVIQPELPQPGEELVAAATAADADNDAVQFLFAWSRDGEVLPEYTRSNIPAGVTALGDTWSVSVTPRDPDDRGVIADDTVIIGDDATGPEIYDVTISPDPAYTTSTLVAVVTASSATVSTTYTWVVNDVDVQEGVAGTLAGSWFVKHDTVQVRVIGSDGSVPSAEVASEVIDIHNSPPGPPTLSITAAGSLKCGILAASVDADEDIVSYRFTWTAGPDGTNIDDLTTDSTLTGDTIPAESATLYPSYTCTVTPFDGEAWGAPASVTYTLEGAGG